MNQNHLYAAFSSWHSMLVYEFEVSWCRFGMLNKYGMWMSKEIGHYRRRRGLIFQIVFSPYFEQVAIRSINPNLSVPYW